MHRGYVHDVMHALSGKVYARKVERMSYHETIDGLGEQFPETCAVHVRRSENSLPGVCAGSSIIIMPGRDWQLP